MTTRRRLLLGAGVVAAQTALPAFALFERKPLLEKIGIQLYTLRHAMDEDFPGTLKALAAIGYREVEFAGYFERSPSEVAAILARNGLAAPAAHVPLQTLQRDLDGAIDAARTIGHNYLVLPWVSSWDYRTARSFEDLARLCNETGKRCRDAGLGFAYHNHAFEFRKDKGKTLYDILLEQTDEELVQFELDLYWAAKAGVDARSYLKGNPGRFPMAHVKDMDAAGNMADVGAGEIDFAALLPVAVKRGTRHFFVEHDKPENAMQTARAGYQALAAL